MTYSEFLARMIKNIADPEQFYMCTEAKAVALYDRSLSKEEKADARIHLKRFLTHMKRLLNKQYKQVCADQGREPDYYSKVLNYIFPSHEAKYQWLVELQFKTMKQEAKQGK